MGDERQSLAEILLAGAQQGASDVHLSPGHYPMLRVDRRLVPLAGQKILDRETLEAVVGLMLGDRLTEFRARGNLTFAYEIEQRARFRVSAYTTLGGLAAAVRFIPETIATPDQLNLPSITAIFAKLSQGIVLAGSPSGHGATTTMAALVNAINRERAEKIITLEDPIEHIFTADKSIVDQRQVGAAEAPAATEAALNQDANVIMLGDLAGAPAVQAALAAAEAGRLIFAALHAGSAVEILERMITAFPPERQDEIRSRLAATIAGTICQRLVPHLKGGLIPALEIMVATTAVRTHIRDNRLKQVDQAIETGYDMGMLSLDRALADRVRRKEISLESAETYSTNPSGIRALVL